MLKSICKALSFFALAIFMFSCSDTEMEETPVEFSKIVNLEVGNYWVYESGGYDENNVFQVSRLDSVVVLSQKIVDGIEVYEMLGSLNFGSPEISLVYDSLNYILSYPSRDVIFTTDPNFVNSIENDFFAGNVKSKSDLELVDVPAGNFECFNYSGTFESKETNYPHGTIVSNKYFAEGVGMVKIEEQYYSSGNKVELRLLRFGKI